MNYMDRDLHQTADVLQTRIEYDQSGMVFVESSEPKFLLSLKNSDKLQKEIESGIKGVFSVTLNRDVEVYFAGFKENVFCWAVIATERRPSVAA